MVSLAAQDVSGRKAMPRRAIVNWTLPGMAGELIYRLRRGHLRPSSQSLLNAGARFWEGEPPGEPRHHPARTDFGLRRAQSSRELSRAEPCPPGITQGRLSASSRSSPRGVWQFNPGRRPGTTSHGGRSDFQETVPRPSVEPGLYSDHGSHPRSRTGSCPAAGDCRLGRQTRDSAIQ